MYNCQRFCQGDMSVKMTPAEMWGLFYHLEFSGLHHGAGFISYLKDVNTTKKFFEIDGYAVGSSGHIVHFFAHKIKYLDRIEVVCGLVKLKSNN